MGRPVRVSLVWQQFGPYHVDRALAAAKALVEIDALLQVVEMAPTSIAYQWDPTGKIEGVQKITLFPDKIVEHVSPTSAAFKLLWCLRDCDVAFICGYHELEFYVAAIVLKVLSKRVYLMIDSKFDDRPRHILREAIKAICCGIYDGAIVAGRRHREYLRFLGFRSRPVLTGYDTVNLDRVLSLGQLAPACTPLKFFDRPFVVVARLVKKKNLQSVITAYGEYRKIASHPRKLIIVGGGDQEPSLRRQLEQDAIAEHVEITGFVQAPEVSRYLSGAIALILASIEEQWGLVVNEARAFSIPVIVSEAVGARDELVNNLVDGFVIEAKNVLGLAQAMKILSEDEQLWHGMRKNSESIRDRADTALFGGSIRELVSKTK